MWAFSLSLYLFSRQFHCVALNVMEFTVYIRLIWNCLPLSPKYYTHLLAFVQLIKKNPNVS